MHLRTADGLHHEVAVHNLDVLHRIEQLPLDGEGLLRAGEDVVLPGIVNARDGRHGGGGGEHVFEDVHLRVIREGHHIIWPRPFDVAPQRIGIGIAHHAGLAAPDDFEAFAEFGECVLHGANDQARADIGGEDLHGAEVVGVVINPSKAIRAVEGDGHTIGRDAQLIGHKNNVRLKNAPANCLLEPRQCGNADVSGGARSGVV